MYALVTGASAGIGLEIARYLAVKGYDLILTARREDRLQKVRRQILDKYPDRKVLVIPADLSRREECLRLFEESCAGAGSENIGMGVYGRFLETDLEKELTLIDLNVTSVHILSKLFLRLMVKNGHGILLNVGSCAGFTSGPTFSSYYASKNYVVRLTEAIHEELRQAKSPVKVCCLCPGPVDTAFNDNSGVTVSGKQITAKQAAREGVDGALKGKMLVIPGTKMKLVTVGSHILGEHLSTKINYHVQKKKAGE